MISKLRCVSGVYQTISSFCEIILIHWSEGTSSHRLLHKPRLNEENLQKAVSPSTCREYQDVISKLKCVLDQTNTENYAMIEDF